MLKITRIYEKYAIVLYPAIAGLLLFFCSVGEGVGNDNNDAGAVEVGLGLGFVVVIIYDYTNFGKYPLNGKGRQLYHKEGVANVSCLLQFPWFVVAVVML